MTKSFKVKEIPLEDIVIGKEHLHDQISDEDIKGLASYISKNGILESILVCPATDRGKYVLLTGIDYFRAYKELNKKTITAVIIHKLNETEIKLLNLHSPQLCQKITMEEMADACSHLFKKYGYSIKEIAEKIGLDIDGVSTPTVDFECLEPEIKKLVKDGDIDLEVAILAHIAFHKEY